MHGDGGRDGKEGTMEDAIIDELISEIDEIARDVDQYDYGLPWYSDDAAARFRQAVRDWLAKHKAAQPSVQRTATPPAGWVQCPYCFQMVDPDKHSHGATA